MRVLTIFSGVLMAASGAFCLVNAGQTFMTMAFVIGAVMVFFGIVHSVSYWVIREDKDDKNGWIFVDGMLTLLLGIMILCNQLTVDIAVPMIFGMWMLTAGLLRIEAATRINKPTREYVKNLAQREKNLETSDKNNLIYQELEYAKEKRGRFRIVFITGVVTALIGLAGLINPFVTYFPIVPLLGFFLIMHGINSIEFGINMPHVKKKAKQKASAKAEVNKTKKKNTNPGVISRAVKIEDEIHETEQAVEERLKQKQEANNEI